MKTTVISLSLALILLNPAWVSAEQEIAPPSLKDLMPPEQYEAAGIDKLNEAEREALAAWLREYVGKNPVATTVEQATVEPAVPAAPAAIAATPTEEVTSVEPVSKALDKNWGFSNPPEEKPAEPELLYANIEGSFRGWSGKSVFRLDNGQVWRQRRSGRFTYTGDDRRVVIGKNSWGFFEMRLIEADRSVGVSRVK